MPGQIRTQQFNRSVKFVPGGVVSIELPRMADIETIVLDMSGTWTYPGGAAGNLTTLKAQALIKRVELICDGKITVLSAPGWAFGIASDRTFEGSGGGADQSMTAPAAGATGSLSAQLFIDLMQFDGINPKDSNLRVRNFSIVELKITFGNWADCFTNAASVPTVYDVTIATDLNLCTELDPSATVPKFVVKRTSQTISATNSNSSHQINLPSGNALRSIKFFTSDNGVATDNGINAILCSNGIDTRVQGTSRAFRSRMRGYKSTQTGFNEVDFARQTRSGVKASDAWAVPSPSQPMLTLDYTGAAGRTIEMVITEYVQA